MSSLLNKNLGRAKKSHPIFLASYFFMSRTNQWLKLKSFSAELIKEACRDLSAGIFSPVQTRLYSPSEEKYICFTKKGQVRAVVSPSKIDSIKDWTLLALKSFFLTILSGFLFTWDEAGRVEYYPHFITTLSILWANKPFIDDLQWNWLTRDRKFARFVSCVRNFI